MRVTRTTRHALAAMGLAVCFATAVPGPSEAAVVERIVAVVGDRTIILLSDLRERARPYLVRIHTQLPPGAQQSAAISQVYKAVLDRMIEEELQRVAARQAQINVSKEEVDEALDRIAAQNGIDKRKLVNEAIKTGLSEAQYRDELQRQVLEAKLMQLRLQGRVRVNEDEMRAEYRKLVLAERQQLPFRIATIVMAATDGAGRVQAERVAARARAGEDFSKLAQRFSADTTTAASGGLLPTMQPGKLPRAVDRAVADLEVGEVTAPVRVGENWIIAQLVERGPSKLSSYDVARAELQQRVYLAKMEKAREHWLENLRRRTYVDIRL